MSVHVYPRDDLIEHVLDDDCTCGPRQRPVANDDGSTSWMVMHHSLNGREKTEETWWVMRDPLRVEVP